LSLRQLPPDIQWFGCQTMPVGRPGGDAATPTLGLAPAPEAREGYPPPKR
jgi:hypothetical protein